jgi:hypothetical protein
MEGKVMTDKPTYRNPCKKCHFIAIFEYPEEVEYGTLFDVYVCPISPMGLVLRKDSYRDKDIRQLTIKDLRRLLTIVSKKLLETVEFDV